MQPMHAHRNPRRFVLTTLLLLATAPCAALAGQVYKCTDAHGHVTFQDAPCPTGTRQQPVQLPDVPPPRPAARMPLPATPPPAQSAPAPASSPPQPPSAPPPPPLYACERATDGSTYTSRNGQPQPYLAPFGMLGAIRGPLVGAYGGRDAARDAASDPQLAHGRITPDLIGSRYVWVQDRCRELSVEETCATLQDELDAAEQSISKAFQSDRPPLQRHADALRAQLAGCR